MLTPQEISGKEFEKAVFGGYYAPAVEEFLETLTADYTALYKENAILKSKIKVLVEKVEEYRTTDDAMRMALLTAQKLGEEITTEAKQKSEEMLSQAENDIRDRLYEMKKKITDEDNRLKSVKEETRKFIAISQEIIRQHTLFLSKLEELNRQPDAEPAAAPIPEPVPETIPEPVLDDPLEATAREIDDALLRLTDTEDDPFAGLYEEEAAKKQQRPKRDPALLENEDEVPATPRPKFEFDNLKFGANYGGD